MTTQSSSEGVPPAATPGAAVDTDSAADRATDQGHTVGAADAAEDARRAGADRDTPLRDTVQEGALDADDPAPTDQGVPVGSADAEADRARASGDDDRA
jgi:hypothetical protein